MQITSIKCITNDIGLRNIKLPPMKKFLTTAILIFTTFLTAQITTINYAGSSAAIANPERGFYKHTETHSTGYYPLNQSALIGYRTNQNITLILRVFYLENFISSPISSSYLTNMQQDFAKLRAAGLKCVIRFAYSDDNDNGLPQDASKDQVLAHIEQLKPILRANSDVIAVAQAGFVGAWGEWYYTTHFGMNPTATDYQNRRSVVQALLNALPGRMVQIRTPGLKMNTFNSNTPLNASQAYSEAELARVAHHNDCFLASSSDYGTYTNISVQYPYLQEETKYLAMGGETCAVNLPRSGCQTAMEEMVKFHWSYLNLDYHASVISGFQNNNCFPEIQNRLGYRFAMISGTFSQTAQVGASLPVTLKIQNQGFATPYNKRTAYLVWRNTVTDLEYRTPIQTDPRLWSAGSVQTISENLPVPANMSPGAYKLYLALPDSNQDLAARPEYSIRMANTNTWDAAKGYNDLQYTVNVTAALSVNQSDMTNTAFTVYPVPTNNELNMEFPDIDQYKVLVHNTLGQAIKLPVTQISANRALLNTQSLSQGIYFVSIEKGDSRETRRIIVNH
jgi:hypothetical protein